MRRQFINWFYYLGLDSIFGSNNCVFVCIYRDIGGIPSTCGRWKTSSTCWSLTCEWTWLIGMKASALCICIQNPISKFYLVFYGVILNVSPRCQQSYSSRSLDKYSALLSDVVPSIPPELLGTLLYEELKQQRDHLLFSEAATGGALAFIPFSQSDSSSQHGCLLYPGNQGLDRLSILLMKLSTGVLKLQQVIFFIL